jgi:hypothetical protein
VAPTAGPHKTSSKAEGNRFVSEGRSALRLCAAGCPGVRGGCSSGFQAEPGPKTAAQLLQLLLEVGIGSPQFGQYPMMPNVM